MAKRSEQSLRSIGARRGLEPGRCDPDHHLWRNGRLWWVALTLHRGQLQERVRRSLETADLALARARRDELIERFASAPGLALSLRFVPCNEVAAHFSAPRRGVVPSRNPTVEGIRP